MEMRTVDRRREFLTQEGYVVIRDFFPRDEIAEVRAAQDRFYNGEFDTEPDFSWPKPRPTRARSRKHPYASFFISPLAKMIRDGRLAKLVGEVSGMAGVRFWHDQLLSEAPSRVEKNSAHWHREKSRWLTCQTAMMTTAWCPLVDFSPEMGPITMIPRSQNSGEIIIPSDWAPEAGTERRMALAAGDVVIFPWTMIHGNPPNLSKLVRRAVAAHFCEKEIRHVKNGRFSHVNERIARKVEGLPDFTDERVCPLLIDDHRINADCSRISIKRT